MSKTFSEWAMKELVCINERLDYLEKYHAAQKGNLEKDRVEQHLGVPHGQNVRSNESQIWQSQSGQAGCGCGNEPEAAQRKAQGLDSWANDGKREGAVEILSDPDRELIYYISGPMASKPDRNFPLFNEVAKTMRESGYRVINPAEIAGVIGPGEERERYLRADVRELCNCSALMLLPDWEQSDGVWLELTVARAFKLPIFYWKHYERSLP